MDEEWRMKKIEMAISKCRICPFREFFVEIGSYCGMDEKERRIKDEETIPMWCPLPDL